jgi:prolipoprotein diacylglyceryltransferase
MVQINTMKPFQIKNFDTAVKTYGISFLAGLLFHFVSGEELQRKRAILFCILFLFLLIIGIIGKYSFANKT